MIITPPTPVLPCMLLMVKITTRTWLIMLLLSIIELFLLMMDPPMNNETTLDPHHPMNHKTNKMVMNICIVMKIDINNINFNNKYHF